MNLTIENELGSCRIEHLLKQEKFDLLNCSPNDAIFLENTLAIKYLAAKQEVLGLYSQF